MLDPAPLAGRPPYTHIINDPETGVKGVIAIDSLALGPAAGGCRLWHYDTDAAMVTDAYRLARGMSYKNAMAGLPFGGGKAVLNKPIGPFDRTAYYLALGDAIEALSGRYITAEDVGTMLADMEAVRTRTRFVAGLAAKPGMAGGDPSLMTARGVFASLKAVAEQRLGLTLDHATVAVQGAGSVGAKLALMLHQAGARVIIADVFAEKASALAADIGARVVDADAILAIDADILVPCALGGILNAATIPEVKARMICGAANNQLAVEADGAALLARGIIYVPDYVVNAGGIINVACEYLGETEAQAHHRVAQIADRVLAVLAEAETAVQPTNVVADAMAQHLIGAQSQSG